MIEEYDKLQDYLEHLNEQGIEYTIVGEDVEDVGWLAVHRKFTKTYPLPDGGEHTREYEGVKRFRKALSLSVVERILKDGNFPEVYLDPIANGKTNTAYKSIRIMEQYEKFLPKSILVAGPKDTGKTYGAIWFIFSQIRNSKLSSAVFVRANELQKGRVGDNYDFLFDKNAPMMVIDDLGVETKSSKVTYINQDIGALLYEILNYRMERLKPTILTTNMSSSAELEKRYGERVVRRFEKFGLFQFIEGGKYIDQENEDLPI